MPKLSWLLVFYKWLECTQNKLLKCVLLCVVSVSVVYGCWILHVELRPG